MSSQKSSPDPALRVQASVESYTHFALEQLVEIKGRKLPDVVAFVLKDWIGDHKEELASYGISVESWRNSKRS